MAAGQRSTGLSVCLSVYLVLVGAFQSIHSCLSFVCLICLTCLCPPTTTPTNTPLSLCLLVGLRVCGVFFHILSLLFLAASTACLPSLYVCVVGSIP